MDHLSIFAPLERPVAVPIVDALERGIGPHPQYIIVGWIRARVVATLRRLVAGLDHLRDRYRQADAHRVRAEEREEGHNNADPSLRDARACKYITCISNSSRVQCTSCKLIARARVARCIDSNASRIGK